ncbi:hypothetical protein NCAS_0A01230 [Naumovozyma castellii]|uniref:Ribosome-recycling factor, mitochondrial n=1 Tax=Naumovozyma castellii TaxID=27288 RepID=G0V5E6_NAUCA|nr:hypothetical protein NCAS_0A01230 [Naumovozyma castellii CBS 4309]CCC66682.1 hypothetical protein NCAS_0A01230 [Naumovozyma castellii CBS 4309]
MLGRYSFSLLKQTRQFTIYSSLLKKRVPLEKASDTEIVDASKYLKEATKQFATTLELHQKRLNETKQGTSNSKVFDNLIISDGKKFTDMATTSMRGNNSLLITVFDPKDTKKIISSILGAGLNLNPERIPNNEQQLKVLLPPVTTESRLNTAKLLKGVFEEYKNSSLKVSLGHIRNQILKEVKSLKKKDDSVRKVITDIEKEHQNYVKKLEEQFKQVEKNVLH